MTPRRAKFGVVIETDSYAGNFEREMCAHLTGHIGECEVGDNFVDEEIELLFESVICDEPDDHGCCRPVALGCDIDGFTANDIVIYFESKPSEEHINIIKERLPSFDYEKNLTIKGINLVEFISETKKTKL